MNSSSRSRTRSYTNTTIPTRSQSLNSTNSFLGNNPTHGDAYTGPIPHTSGVEIYLDKKRKNSD